MFGAKADDSHISSFVETGTSGILFVLAGIRLLYTRSR
jgi:hypothetical protein